MFSFLLFGSGPNFNEAYQVLFLPLSQDFHHRVKPGRKLELPQFKSSPVLCAKEADTDESDFRGERRSRVWKKSIIKLKRLVRKMNLYISNSIKKGTED